MTVVGKGEEFAFTQPFTQEMMSDALGLSVPHLNRMLTKLRAEGMIAVNERRVEFIDLRARSCSRNFSRSSRRECRFPMKSGLIKQNFRALAVQLAQLGLQHLAVIVLRQRLEENVVAGPFEPRDRG